MSLMSSPKNAGVDGRAFLGLSLARKGERGHPDSATHQTSFDLDLLQDRDYECIFRTFENGWMAGGGEPGPLTSYELAATDCAHLELMRIGTGEEVDGGIPQHVLMECLRNGEILIPEVTVVPTAVSQNRHKPLELEIRFDMVPPIANFDDLSEPLPANWPLRFLQNQLFEKFQCKKSFGTGDFHTTIFRKAEFRSEAARNSYFSKCRAVCQEWIERGPQPLVPSPDGVSPSIEVVKCQYREDNCDVESHVNDGEEGPQTNFESGLWLFADRNNISHRFLPNFFPPYDTPAKKQLIFQVLQKRWDENNPVPNSSGPVSLFSASLLPSLEATFASVHIGMCASVLPVMDCTGVVQKESTAVPQKPHNEDESTPDSQTSRAEDSARHNSSEGEFISVNISGNEPSNIESILRAEVPTIKSAIMLQEVDVIKDGKNEDVASYDTRREETSSPCLNSYPAGELGTERETLREEMVTTQRSIDSQLTMSRVTGELEERVTGELEKRGGVSVDGCITAEDVSRFLTAFATKATNLKYEVCAPAMAELDAIQRNGAINLRTTEDECHEGGSCYFSASGEELLARMSSSTLLSTEVCAPVLEEVDALQRKDVAEPQVDGKVVTLGDEIHENATIESSINGEQLFARMSSVPPPSASPPYQPNTAPTDDDGQFPGPQVTVGVTTIGSLEVNVGSPLEDKNSIEENVFLDSQHAVNIPEAPVERHQEDFSAEDRIEGLPKVGGQGEDFMTSLNTDLANLLVPEPREPAFQETDALESKESTAFSLGFNSVVMEDERRERVSVDNSTSEGGVTHFLTSFAGHVSKVTIEVCAPVLAELDAAKMSAGIYSQLDSKIGMVDKFQTALTDYCGPCHEDQERSVDSPVDNMTTDNIVPLTQEQDLRGEKGSVDSHFGSNAAVAKTEKLEEGYVSGRGLGENFVASLITNIASAKPMDFGLLLEKMDLTYNKGSIDSQLSLRSAIKEGENRKAGSVVMEDRKHEGAPVDGFLSSEGVTRFLEYFESHIAKMSFDVCGPGTDELDVVLRNDARDDSQMDGKIGTAEDENHENESVDSGISGEELLVRMSKASRYHDELGKAAKEGFGSLREQHAPLLQAMAGIEDEGSVNSQVCFQTVVTERENLELRVDGESSGKPQELDSVPRSIKLELGNREVRSTDSFSSGVLIPRPSVAAQTIFSATSDRGHLFLIDNDVRLTNVGNTVDRATILDCDELLQTEKSAKVDAPDSLMECAENPTSWQEFNLEPPKVNGQCFDKQVAADNSSALTSPSRSATPSTSSVPTSGGSSISKEVEKTGNNDNSLEGGFVISVDGNILEAGIGNITINYSPWTQEIDSLHRTDSIGSQLSGMWEEGKPINELV